MHCWSCIRVRGGGLISHVYTTTTTTTTPPTYMKGRDYGILRQTEHT